MASTFQHRIRTVKAGPEQAGDEEQDVADPCRVAGGCARDALPADQNNAADDQRRADQMRARQSLAEQDSRRDGADDRHRRRRDHGAIGQRRECVAAGLQQREWCASEDREDDASPPAEARQIRQAPPDQRGEHHQAGDDIAGEDHVVGRQADENAGAGRRERDSGAERHGEAAAIAERTAGAIPGRDTGSNGHVMDFRTGLTHSMALPARGM